jgi:hypothetical protein
LASEGVLEIHPSSIRFPSEKTPVVCPAKIRSSSDGKSGSRRAALIPRRWFVRSPPRPALVAVCKDFAF